MPRTPWRSFAAVVALAAPFLSCNGEPARGGHDPQAPAPAVRRAVLAETRAEWPGVSVQIVGASRDRGTLTIRWRIANAGPQVFEFADRFAADAADRGSVADVTVIDADGRRKYFVLRDRANKPACSSDLAPLRPGEERVLFARFPAPPAGTSRITIQIPHVPELREVPLADGGGEGGTG